MKIRSAFFILLTTFVGIECASTSTATATASAPTLVSTSKSKDSCRKKQPEGELIQIIFLLI